MIGDGDPTEHGFRLPCGCNWIHPPYGPAYVTPSLRYMIHGPLPWWRRLLGRLPWVTSPTSCAYSQHLMR